ncbi:MAG: ATPase [Alphaproteobacteria bacterium]|jgi:hypothetical protein|nr:ATPase [Alphaproteobacteria bacterium]
MKHLTAIALAVFLAIPSIAAAKVAAQSATGFVVEHKVDVKGDAKAAYDAFIKVGSWWSSSHSFSGDAKNLTIETKPGGCWCEALPDGGFVKHMEVIHAAPGSMLVFSGGLGPLQFMGVAGSMTVSFKPGKGVTTVTLRYDVGGRDDKNFEGISKGVDGVIAEQFARYANFASNGKP